MIKCDYCEEEMYDKDEYVHGYEEKSPNEILTVCKDCAELRNNFIKINNYEKKVPFKLNICKDVYKRFIIQYIVDDPSTIYQEWFVCADIDDVYQYAKKKYRNKLMGIEFDQYVDQEGNELTYNIKNKWFEVLENI